MGDNVAELPDLIGDSSQVDYMKYIPEMVIDSNIKKALDIKKSLFRYKCKISYIN